MKTKYFWVLSACIIFSLFLHSGVFLGLKLANPPIQLRNTVPIEVSYLKNKPQDKQFVTDPELGEVLNQLQQDVRRLSRFSRRVRKEQVASQSGPTKNRTQKKWPQIKQETVDLKKIKLKKNSTLALNAKKELQNFENIEASLPSTLGEYIPNVAEGSFTSLNTNQFRFYAFFKRINEQIRLRWVNNIRQISLNISPKTSNQLAMFERVSKLELVFDAKGEFVSSFIDKSSGAKFLDDAAINAFIDSAPFINPPKDLVDADGYIRLNYSFHLKWKPTFMAKDKSLGN